jgi:two-component system NtrC family sensor kinase
VKLQTKFNIGIIIIFTLLAAAIVAMSVNYVNANTIREAENRVRIYARAAWEILDGKTERIRTASEILAQDRAVKDLLRNPGDEEALIVVQEYLEAVRQEEGMDILNVLTSGGTVILRTRAPYNDGDSLIDDPMVRQVIQTRQSNSGYVILELERMDIEGTGLFERCMAVGGEPRGMLAGAAVPVMDDGELLGIIQMGALLNGASEKVDRIRDAVFENEFYAGKPVGTATIFMGDLRISTNVMDSQGRRAVGTRVSKQVADQVLTEGLSWTGRAFVVDTWYLSQYDPIRDPDGDIIGMLYVGELEQKYLDIRTRAVAQFLAVTFAGMAVAFLTFFFLVRSVVHPIHQLSEATRHLSNGDLAHRVREVAGKDEVSDLTASFNHMAKRLERQRQEIERRQEELERVSEELNITNQNYIDMLGFVTHELKNPLASATMSLYTVKDGYLGELNPAQEKSLNAVARSLHYFHDMVKNYLDLSRLEKGELEVKKRAVPIYPQVIVPVLDGLDQELHEYKMVVENRIPEDLTLNVDGDLLKIVYDNLISNAIKYGRECGAIVIDIQNSEDQVTMSVLNDSAGISPEKIPLLFGKFSRLDDPEYAGKKGTGLGLFICKEIIEKHGGEIWADSQMGEWVKFSFTLPKN